MEEINTADGTYDWLMRFCALCLLCLLYCLGQKTNCKFDSSCQMSMCSWFSTLRVKNHCKVAVMDFVNKIEHTYIYMGSKFNSLWQYDHH